VFKIAVLVFAVVLMILAFAFITAERGLECLKHGYQKGKRCPWCLDDQTRSD
jgi:hypothetical protein